MRRKADNAAGFPSLQLQHILLFSSVFPHTEVFLSSTQFFVPDADCQKPEDSFGVETFPQSLIAECFIQKFKKI
ncbi:hypothetical protein LRP_584 [Ligilactobacillus ruminis]|nr:hypothetical protein LRP_584 [Ligilactobacillus ruminis]